MTDRYYELHITLLGEPSIIQPAVEQAGWSFSRIDGDPVEGLGVKCYATAHRHASMGEDAVLGLLMSTAAVLAQVPGVDVTRQKIELVIHDTRSEKIRLSPVTVSTAQTLALAEELIADLCQHDGAGLQREHLRPHQAMGGGPRPARTPDPHRHRQPQLVPAQRRAPLSAGRPARLGGGRVR